MTKSFKGHLRVLQAVGEKLCRVEILALNDQITANGWRYTNLEQHLNQFQDIPILTAYTKHGDGIGSGHNFTMRKDEDGEEYCSFTDSDAERIVGWVPSDAEIRLETRPADGAFHRGTGLSADSRKAAAGGHPTQNVADTLQTREATCTLSTQEADAAAAAAPSITPTAPQAPSDADCRETQWIIVTGALWRWYSRELVDKITASKGGMDVSIETLVTASHMEPDGTEVEEEYTVLGITVLGNGTEPAVKGAGIRRLNEARKRMRPEVEKAQSLSLDTAHAIERAATLSCSEEYVRERSAEQEAVTQSGVRKQDAVTTEYAEYANEEPKETGQLPCSDSSGSFHPNSHPERSNAMDDKDLVTPQEATEPEAVHASSCKEKEKECGTEEDKEGSCKPKDKKDGACMPKDKKDGACGPEKEKEEACKPKKEKDSACEPEDEKAAACRPAKRKKSAGQTCEEEEPDAEDPNSDGSDAEKEDENTACEPACTGNSCRKDNEMEALKKENASLRDRLLAFEQQEKARRCETAAAAAQEEFEKVNRLCAFGTLASSVIDGIKTLAAGGGYSNTLDFEGNWYGDAEARRDVRALCMLELMKSGEALEKEKQRESAGSANSVAYATLSGNSDSNRTESPAPRYRTWALAQNSASREAGSTVLERLKAKAEA